MDNSKIIELAQCSPATITRAKDPLYKDSKLIKYVRFLINIESEYLNKIFKDPLHRTMCDVVIDKAPGKAESTVIHAQKCNDYRDYILGNIDDETLSTHFVTTAIEWNDNYANWLFSDAEYLNLCSIAIQKSRDGKVRAFAARLKNECLLLRGRVNTRTKKKVKSLTDGSAGENAEFLQNIIKKKR